MCSTCDNFYCIIDAVILMGGGISTCMGCMISKLRRLSPKVTHVIQLADNMILRNINIWSIHPHSMRKAKHNSVSVYVLNSNFVRLSDSVDGYWVPPSSDTRECEHYIRKTRYSPSASIRAARLNFSWRIRAFLKESIHSFSWFLHLECWHALLSELLSFI